MYVKKNNTRTLLQEITLIYNPKIIKWQTEKIWKLTKEKNLKKVINYNNDTNYITTYQLS